MGEWSATGKAVGYTEIGCFENQKLPPMPPFCYPAGGFFIALSLAFRKASPAPVNIRLRIGFNQTGATPIIGATMVGSFRTNKSVPQIRVLIPAYFSNTIIPLLLRVTLLVLFQKIAD